MQRAIKIQTRHQVSKRVQRSCLHDAVADICIGVPAVKRCWATFTRAAPPDNKQNYAKEDALLIRVQHRVMDNERLRRRRNASREHKMVIVAHVQQHGERPGDVRHKLFPRVLALADQRHRRI